MDVIKQMVEIDPFKRASPSEIEELASSFFENNSQTLVNSFSEVPKIENLQTNSNPNLTIPHE